MKLKEKLLKINKNNIRLIYVNVKEDISSNIVKTVNNNGHILLKMLLAKCSFKKSKFPPLSRILSIPDCKNAIEMNMAIKI